MILLKRNGLLLLFCLISVLFSGCRSTDNSLDRDCAGQRNITDLSAFPQNSTSYMKVARTEGAPLQLHVASKRLLPKRGNKPEIWLVAVTHIGESNYYNDIQKHLDEMTLVLYEGIKIRHKEVKKNEFKTANSTKAPPATSEYQTDNPGDSEKISDSIQSKLAKSLGLAFQLDAINYSRSHFENCDMTINHIEKIFSDQIQAGGEKSTEATEEWEKLKSLYLGDSLISVFADVLLKIIGSSPRMSAMMKIIFIETLSRVEGDLTQWEGIPDGMKQLINVLIKERNNIIISRLKEILPRMKKGDRIALFYGAAHMPDLEKRVCAELGYKLANERWYKAFEVNPESYGISETEINFLRRLAEGTIRQMKLKY